MPVQVDHSTYTVIRKTRIFIVRIERSSFDTNNKNPWWPN